MNIPHLLNQVAQAAKRTQPEPLGEVLWNGFKTVQGIAGGILFVAATITALFWITKSCRLVRGTFADEPSGRVLEVVRVVAAAWFARVFGSKSSGGAHTIYERVRIRIEHELLYPRPKLAEAVSPAQYEADFADWRQYMRRHAGDVVIGGYKEDAAAKGNPPATAQASTTRALTAGNVNDAFDRITRYFVVLHELKASENLRFVCSVRIDTGFIAPLHLLAGLLSRFDEDWRKILDAFNRDILKSIDAPWTGPLSGDHGKPPWVPDFCMIQKFIFDCWLQWGPSIPHSSSSDDLEWTAIQYGYGDENNSIDVVGPRDYLEKRIAALWERQQAKSLAAPARVQGRLAHCKFVPNVEKNVSAALQKSWNVHSKDLSDGRILLLVDEEPRAIEGRSREFYYSAYLWVQLVILAPETAERKLRPLHHSDAKPHETTEPWLDFLPFFEHCNIACPAALSQSKRLLALKSLDAIRQLVDRAGGRERLPLRFAYACAIDDPGDAGKPLLEALELVEPMDEKQWDPQKARIGDWMKKLGERAEYADLFAPADPIIRLDYYKPFDIARRPYSTHRLIDHVHEALDHVDAPAPSP